MSSTAHQTIDASAPAPPLASARMQIVCGTDFSKNATQAAEAAAAFATRLREPLVLIHAIDEPARAQLPAELRESLSSFAQQRLSEEAQRLHDDGAEVQEVICQGTPETVLTQFASHAKTRLVVLSSLGHHAPAPLGSVAERVAQASPVPTLIVRTAAPFVSWAEGKRSLRIFVGADFSIISDAALGWVRWLRQFGSCEVVVAYLERGNSVNVSPTVAEMLTKTEEVQARCFRQRVRDFLGSSKVRVRLEKGWGRSDAHLIQLATEERADLIVVGTHRSSRGVLHYAPMSVICAPATEGTPRIAAPVNLSVER
jgi:nucleotide-binding universal stress UspA family protein